MKLGESRSAIIPSLVILAFLSPADPMWAAPPPASDSQPETAAPASPEDEIVEKFLRDCAGKAVKGASCDKLRNDFVAILKEDLLTLGSSANRQYLPDIVRIFRKR